MGAIMSLYFFDSDDGELALQDETGTDFSSVDAARDEAMRTLCELGCDHLRGPRSPRQITLSVRTPDGELMLHLSLTSGTRPAHTLEAQARWPYTAHVT